MSKYDLAAWPINHHKRESIEAHLSVVFAALAVSRLIEDCTGWSIRKFVRTTRRYRTVQIRVASRCPPPRTRHHPIYATSSRSSAQPTGHTNLSQVGDGGCEVGCREGADFSVYCRLDRDAHSVVLA